MMGLGLVPLVCVHFALEIPLVVSVAYAMAFLFQLELSQLATLFCWWCLYQKESISKLVDS